MFTEIPCTPWIVSKVSRTSVAVYHNTKSSAGNEADFVIVSLIRSTGPGCLNLNRANVMLTRCKNLGMVIVTNRNLLERIRTLVGQLATYWQQQNGAERTWADWRLVSQC